MRRWLFWLLVIAFVWIVVSRFAQIEKLAQTLSQGTWTWVLAAALLQVVYYGVYSALYQAAFRTVDVSSRWRDLLPLVFVSIFVNVAAPTGGASGAALFVDDAAQRGQSAARTAIGTLLVLLADFGAFALVLVVGMIYLFSQHDLQVYEVGAAGLLLLMILGLTAILCLGLWRPSWLRRLLGGVQRLGARMAAWLKRPAPLAEEWTEKTASDFTGAAAAMRAHPGRLAGTLAIALASHLIDLATLYVTFLAFHHPISIGPLVAGYAMGILFWIVSITPQGIGVVEGVMALVYTSLGVPGPVATATALVFRGLGFWLPLGLGFVMLRRVKRLRGSPAPRNDLASVRVAALLTGAMGLINVLSAVTPGLAARMAVIEQFLPLEVRRGGHLTAALAGFALLVLSAGLWRRKRMAWWLTLAVLAVSVVSHLVKGLDYEEALIACGLGLWLLSLRHHFHARSDRPSIRQGLWTAGAALGFTLVYGTIGFALLDRHFSVNFGLGAALRQTVVMFTQFYNPGLEPITGFGRYFAGSVYAIGAATLGYALLMVIRPVLVREPATSAERSRARAIVQAHGRSSLARVLLFDDKSYFFTPGGSVVAYAAKGRGAVALGDPVGPPDDVAAAIAGFRDLCQENDWVPAFYQTPPESLEFYAQAGFESLCIGQEGIVDLAAFTLEGKASKDLRSPVNRLTRLGYRAELHAPPQTEERLRELRGISDEWLTTMHGGEKRFSLGWFEDGYVRDGPVMAVHAPEGWITAFANILPEYQRNEVTIDLMRHRARVESGTMDFLFVSLLEWARSQGYASFNLGMSSLSGVGEHLDDPAAERVLHFIYEHINQFYNFKGLHSFKEKFQPIWSPRYLVHPGATSMPNVLATLALADAGESGLWGYLRGAG